ncbi:MAG: ATP-binding protein [Acidobacteriales bacterium]|nr:ATP-binding protein [Terriglobales bacterium]
MPEAVFIFDRDGRLVEFNTPAQRLCGREPRELRGLNLKEVVSRLDVRSDGKRVEFPNLAVSRALGGEAVRHERRVLHNAESGTSCEVVVSANPMHNHDGDVIGALVVVRDVTEVQHLQKRLADTDRHLAIGQMAAGIAHDVNNVLSTISQAGAVLEHKVDLSPSDRKLYFGLIQNAVRQGAEIVQRIREYIRGGTGERLPTDVGNVLHEALELTKPMWGDARDRRIDVRTKISPLPLVEANAADLRRVFANLIINAIDAMPHGGLLTIDGFLQDHTVNVRIKDTGVGIPPEQQNKIFLPYYTTKAKGTGLGLSGAQRIVESLGGCIAFSSEVGKGAAFTVQLPMAGLRSDGKREERAA